MFNDKTPLSTAAQPSPPSDLFHKWKPAVPAGNYFSNRMPFWLVMTGEPTLERVEFLGNRIDLGSIAGEMLVQSDFKLDSGMIRAMNAWAAASSPFNLATSEERNVRTRV